MSPETCSLPSANGNVLLIPFLTPSGPRLRAALPAASRMPSGSSGPFSNAFNTAWQSFSISFSVTPSFSATFMSPPPKASPAFRPSAKSAAGKT